MSRYIDADALKKRVSELIVPDWTRTLIRSWLDSEPTVDAAQVVRCMECKYMRESVDGLFKSGYFCERCHITSDMENCDDFYCADGERRTE